MNIKTPLSAELQQVIADRLRVSCSEIEDYCQHWQITEFALFGSVLRHDFRPDSDIDVLVVFAPDSHWGLFDLMEMERELAAKFGREVDLVEKQALKNPYRRANILQTHQVIYAG